VYKNFSPHALGVLGRQSEMIEYAMTYGFRGLDIDMHDMLTRAQRKDVAYAARYLKSADIIRSGFFAPVQLGADDATFATGFAKLQAMADLANKLMIKRAYIELPNASEKHSYRELFDLIRGRLDQMGTALATHGVKLGVSFRAGKDEKAKGNPFVQDVEGFLALLRAVRNDNVGYILDSWSWFVGGGGSDQLNEISGDSVVCVRLADPAGSKVPATMNYFDRDVPTTKSAELIDHVAFIKKLKDAGYAGPVSPYPHSEVMRGRTREVIVRATQEAIDHILTGAGIIVPPRPMDTINDRQDLHEPQVLGA
jgi:sugar phosphate isomerase/epimerase